MDMKIALTNSQNNNLIRSASIHIIYFSSHENPCQVNQTAKLQFSLHAPDSQTMSKTPKMQVNLPFARKYPESSLSLKFFFSAIKKQIRIRYEEIFVRDGRAGMRMPDCTGLPSCFILLYTVSHGALASTTATAAKTSVLK